MITTRVLLCVGLFVSVKVFADPWYPSKWGEDDTLGSVNEITHELVADNAWEFMFVLGQARVKGAVQIVINPVAIR